MTYGRFSDESLEFQITNPEPPRPWQNYAWNEQYVISLNQNGDGRSQYKAPDCEDRASLLDARRVYFEENGFAWCAGYMPICARPDHFACRVGLHYSVIEQRMRGIESSWRIFVPLDLPVEVWTLRLRNVSDENRSLRVFPGVHFCLDSFPITVQPHEFLIDGVFDIESNAIWATNKSYERPNRNCTAFFASDAPVRGFDVAASAVYDPYRKELAPRFLGTGCSNRAGGDMGRTVGFFEHHIDLAPYDETVLNFVIGSRFDDANALNWPRSLFSKGRIEEEFERRRSESQRQFGRVRLESGLSHLDRMANVWTPHQVRLGSTWARIYLVGTRDMLQDGQGIMALAPELGRHSLLAVMAHQHSDGSCLRGWDPVVPVKPSDCHLWMTLTLVEYIKETGNMAFFEELVPWWEGGEATVLEHWWASLENSWQNRGEHGLCLIFDCDWSDSLTVGEAGRGESVMNTEMLVYCMKLAIPLLHRLGEDTRAELLRQRVADLTTVLNEVAWDGHWYRRAYNDAGEVIGSVAKPEYGAIYLNAQTWAALAGIADDAKLASMDAAVREQLLCQWGYLVLSPGFKKETPAMCRIGTSNVGTYENGSVYCHANAFKIVSEYARGRVEDAWELMRLMFTDPNFNPAARDSDGEPYVFGNQFYGPEGLFPGKTHAGWTTGTAAWMLQVMLKYLPGVHPDYDGLRICASLPADLPALRLYRTFRGADYVFDISRDDTLSCGMVRLELDGVALPGDLVPLQPEGAHCEVRVRQGTQTST